MTNGPFTFTVEANVRWWVGPLMKCLERVVNLVAWVVTEYGIKVNVR